MLFSPAARLLNSENSETKVLKKVGNNLSVRKPFADKDVNGKSPVKSPKKLGKTPAKKAPQPQEFSIEDFTCSYKTEDDFEDEFWLNPKEQLENDLKYYCYGAGGLETPPPEFEPTFEEVPISPLQVSDDPFEIFHKEVCKKLEEHQFELEDIDITYIDYDEFNDSV
ncbi:uncharacterized protein LOC109601389 [Aethina tumida]|uniref:uncharacterized protein LOC109601389 n=1 Tax=Aethina tumida TaxID=116153 RepID=UPI00096B1E9C|nr:uncharacterized protein LOC109601389 [Aethina tumida]